MSAKYHGSGKDYRSPQKGHLELSHVVKVVNTDENFYKKSIQSKNFDLNKTIKSKRCVVAKNIFQRILVSFQHERLGKMPRMHKKKTRKNKDQRKQDCFYFFKALFYINIVLSKIVLEIRNLRQRCHLNLRLQISI